MINISNLDLVLQLCKKLKTSVVVEIVSHYTALPMSLPKTYKQGKKEVSRFTVKVFGRSAVKQVTSRELHIANGVGDKNHNYSGKR